VTARESRVDREVRELLREEPDLLALAERIASLRPEDVDAARDVEGHRRLRLPGSVRALVSTIRRRRLR
jgi:hypothetical protein